MGSAASSRAGNKSTLVYRSFSGGIPQYMMRFASHASKGHLVQYSWALRKYSDASAETLAQTLERNWQTLTLRYSSLFESFTVNELKAIASFFQVTRLDSYTMMYLVNGDMVIVEAGSVSIQWREHEAIKKRGDVVFIPKHEEWTSLVTHRGTGGDSRGPIKLSSLGAALVMVLDRSKLEATLKSLRSHNESSSPSSLYQRLLNVFSLDVLGSLRRLPQFSKARLDSLLWLSVNVSFQYYGSREKIQVRGKRSTGMFLVLQGSVFQEMEDVSYGPGTLVGELEALLSVPCIGTITSETTGCLVAAVKSQSLLLIFPIEYNDWMYRWQKSVLYDLAWKQRNLVVFYQGADKESVMDLFDIFVMEPFTSITMDEKMPFFFTLCAGQMEVHRKVGVTRLSVGETWGYANLFDPDRSVNLLSVKYCVLMALSIENFQLLCERNKTLLRSAKLSLKGYDV